MGDGCAAAADWLSFAWVLLSPPARSTINGDPRIENSPGTKAYVVPQLGHSAPDRPDIAWIAADGALSLGLGDRLGPEIRKAPDPTREFLSTADCCHPGGVALWIRQGKGWRRRFQSQTTILRTLKIRSGQNL